jgi:hypothetical protein
MALGGGFLNKNRIEKILNNRRKYEENDSSSQRRQKKMISSEISTSRIDKSENTDEGRIYMPPVMTKKRVTHLDLLQFSNN